ncbi:MAG TPA: alginate export family protein [Methylophilaceae bacterium]|nr:alginate export family protein [Methylophilaceae bacterium]
MTKLRNTTLAGLVAAAVTAVPAYAEEAPAAPAEYTFLDSVKAGKPLTNFRLRYENVDQDGKAEEADAFTLRSLIGWQTAPWHNFSIAAQVINVGVFNDDYDNFDKAVIEPGKSAYPRVVDPDDTDINQLFVEWTGIRNTKLRLGRQSVKLDNVRFIGNIEFRQVMQVFDGVALENKNLLPNTSIYLAHFDRVKQITTKYQDANVEIANVKYSISPSEALVGYGYLIDWNGSPRAGNVGQPNPDTTSSKTFGARLDGTRVINPDWKVLYTAEYAKQDDYKDGNDNIDSHYLRLGGGAMYGTWYARIDHEILSSNDGLSAFQTPLGTNHLFQGWVDQFLVTPNAGIKDTFFSFGGKVFGVALSSEYHIFKSDEDFRTIGNSATNFTGDKYGTEIDVAAAYTYQKWMGKVEYGRFREDDELGATLTAATRKRDTEKLWLTVMYTF